MSTGYIVALSIPTVFFSEQQCRFESQVISVCFILVISVYSILVQLAEQFDTCELQFLKKKSKTALFRNHLDAFCYLIGALVSDSCGLYRILQSAPDTFSSLESSTWHFWCRCSAQRNNLIIIWMKCPKLYAMETWGISSPKAWTDWSCHVIQNYLFEISVDFRGVKRALVVLILSRIRCHPYFLFAKFDWLVINLFLFLSQRYPQTSWPYYAN